MHVERMNAVTTRTLEDYPHGLAPITVGDDHEVSLLWCRRGPIRILLNGVQGGVCGIINVIDPIVHEGMNHEPLDERECEI